MSTRNWLPRLLILAMLAAASLSSLSPAAHAQETGDSFGQLYLPLVARSSGLVDPWPAEGAGGQSLNTWLAWNFIETGLPDPHYTVLLAADDATPDTVIAADIRAPHYSPGTLELDTLYYWQVIARGSNGVTVTGPVWRFRTEPWWNTPPVNVMMTVPAGEFLMGCDAANPGVTFACSGKDTPLHRVWLDAYAIDKFEVTNGQYVACVQAGACQWPRKSSSHEREDYLTNPAYNDYPVLYVSRQDGINYCAWTGKRLPTEAEWEKAARGPFDTRAFPWGNTFPDCTRGNRPSEQSCPAEPNDTARVGRYPRGASPYGVHDLSGNVFEWVQDKYVEGYYATSPYRNPVNLQPNGNDFYGIRGGSYRDRFAYMRTFHRHFGHHGDTVGGDAPNYRSDRVGFRCAVSLP
jgi:formylglycine-generating enzyme required for sulfatase activity